MQPVAVFHDALSSLRTRFPWLVVNEVENHPQVEAFAEIPVQPGLSIPIQINLQNTDELHLVASNLWVEWFPCTDQIKRDRFLQAVAGLVSGDLEIEESFVLGKPATAALKFRGAGGEKKHLARWSNLRVLLPLPRSRRVVRNESAA